MAARRRAKSARRTAHQKLKRKVKGAVRERPETRENSAKRRGADDYGAKLLALKGSVPDDVAL
jgi:hypothetical protein